MILTKQTRKPLVWPSNAFCVGLLAPLLTVGLLISPIAQTPQLKHKQTGFSLPQMNIKAAMALYSFPTFNMPNRSIDKQSRGAMATLFDYHIYDVFDKFLFSTVDFKLPSDPSYGEPGNTLPLISATAVMTLAHPKKTDATYTVVLDPGHGGSDPGTVGADGLLEKELTLEMARRVRDLLRPHSNIRIKLTRDNDRGFSRANRVKHIRAAQGDLLVSLHLNNLPQRDLTIVETFYADRENILESEMERNAQLIKSSDGAMLKAKLTRTASRTDNFAYTQKSRRIASILQKSIYEQVSRNNPTAIDAGVKKETLYTLTRSEMPGTLIELTCLSNKSEEQRLKSLRYRQKIAESIAEGLLEYFSSPIASTSDVIEGI